MVAGLQVMSKVSGWGVSRLEQLSLALETEAVPVPPVTAATSDPVAVQPDDVTVIDVVPGLVPLSVSGGENDTVPVRVVQVTLPVATTTLGAPEVGVVLELHPAANATTTPSGNRIALEDLPGMTPPSFTLPVCADGRATPDGSGCRQEIGGFPQPGPTAATGDATSGCFINLEDATTGTVCSYER